MSVLNEILDRLAKIPLINEDERILNECKYCDESNQKFFKRSEMCRDCKEQYDEEQIFKGEQESEMND